MRENIDVIMVKWLDELKSTWREMAEIVAAAVRRHFPEADVYVIGGVAENRITAP